MLKDIGRNLPGSGVEAFDKWGPLEHDLNKKSVCLEQNLKLLCFKIKKEIRILLCHHQATARVIKHKCWYLQLLLF